MVTKFRELSYANPKDPWWKRKMVETIEALSGRHRFLPLYQIWRTEIVGHSDRVMGDLLKLINVELAIKSGHWPPVIAPDVPLVIVANHPFGIGDGIAALAIAEQLGRPYKVLLNRDLTKVPEILPYSLAVDFEESKEAMKFNIETRKEALDLLAKGWTIVVFPGGGVATAHTPWGKAEELPWKMFTARMIMSAKAAVLPVYFEGQNSWIFHLVSRFSLTLRLSLLVSEFRRFAGSVCKVRIGDVVPFDELTHKDDRKELMQELYDRVHALGELEVTNEVVEERGGRRLKTIKAIRRIRRKASELIPDREDIKRKARDQVEKVKRLKEKAVDAIPERHEVADRIQRGVRRIKGKSDGGDDRDAA
ncbi:MAG: glycerol acyltransferase [Rhizobiales bacterium]|nr:glycerol acyltransferase [Hyphomicrobiales bacterium]